MLRGKPMPLMPLTPMILIMLMLFIMLILMMLTVGSFMLLAQPMQWPKAQMRVDLTNIPASTTNITTKPGRVGETAPTLDCSGTWQIVSSPNPSTGDNALSGVAAFSSNDIWAIGAFRGTSRTQTLTIHWDGTQWSQVPSPNRGTTDNILLGVGAVSTNNAWAVGYSGSVATTLVEHWDGQAWTIVPSPNPSPNSDNLLRAISVVSSNDVWAVGYYIEVIGTFGYRRTLAEHWDGVQWSTIPSPNVGTDSNELLDVSVISTNDIWAVGYYGVSSGDSLTLIEHWNGSQWSIVPNPNPSGANGCGLRGVSAISPNDVWAVGVGQTGPGWAIHWWSTGTVSSGVSCPVPVPIQVLVTVN